jgi:hypothetical protein
LCSERRMKSAPEPRSPHDERSPGWYIPMSLNRALLLGLMSLGWSVTGAVESVSDDQGDTVKIHSAG